MILAGCETKPPARAGGFVLAGTGCEAAVVTVDSAPFMPAAVYVGEGAIEVQQLPVPTLGSDDALVEVSHCGICGTDLHLVLERFARPGSVLGHEWSGTIAALGSAARGWEIGAARRARPHTRMRSLPRVPARPSRGVPAPRST